MVTVIILFLCLSFGRIVNGFTCESTKTECETSLVISHYLTMLHPVHRAVYPYNGKLYKYDVNDTSKATPIPVDEVITADGWESQRLVIVANNTMPGPPIILYEGQKITIHVFNHLQSDTVSIHWHGLPQEGTPYMDGVGFVSQCPIQPGSFFTYQFIARPKGTYWYHSHVGSQRSKGLFGAFIIRSRSEIADDVEERIMSIQDWNHDWDSDMDHQKMVYGIYYDRKKHSPSRSLDGSYFSLFRVQSGLINGRGRYYDPSTGLHNGSPLEVFEVKEGRKYRFRIIATGALYPFRISIDGHNMSVIESDGYYVEPITADSIIINPGERYDVLIHTDKPVANYWIRGQTLESNRKHIAEAILRYSGAPDNEPVTSQRICKPDDRCLVINCPFTYYPTNEYTDCLRFDHLKSKSTNDQVPPFIAGKFKEYFLNFAFPGTTFTPGSVNGRKFELPPVSAISQPREISTSLRG
ncbi:hypothetical protein KUTeg_020509 [Tegillarca granosa]|uniref:Laccase n=1 Tax=Tegillarca granosa TaxID=220873 RepID=A0ABQ9E884_TEGGR|nr:hypothetical protein KUTeg_020509 [Tegillarca granosa]